MGRHPLRRAAVETPSPCPRHLPQGMDMHRETIKMIDKPSIGDMYAAAENALKGHSSKRCVRAFREDYDANVERLYRDYEVRRDSKGEPNWLKCLIAIPEKGADGRPTGRTLAREFHGGYRFLIEFITACEQEYGKDALLPIECVTIDNQCGYIFTGSTNRTEYFDD